MSILYHRRAATGAAAPAWWTMVPLFVVGFAVMSAIRSIGDLGATGRSACSMPEQWNELPVAGMHAW